jgi:hypothetical protein
MIARKRAMTIGAVLALVACSDRTGVTADGVTVWVRPTALVIARVIVARSFHWG